MKRRSFLQAAIGGILGAGTTSLDVLKVKKPIPKWIPEKNESVYIGWQAGYNVCTGNNNIAMGKPIE